jgi:hypothetical protein
MDKEDSAVCFFWNIATPGQDYDYGKIYTVTKKSSG